MVLELLDVVDEEEEVVDEVLELVEEEEVVDEVVVVVVVVVVDQISFVLRSRSRASKYFLISGCIPGLVFINFLSSNRSFEDISLSPLDYKFIITED